MEKTDFIISKTKGLYAKFPADGILLQDWLKCTCSHLKKQK